MDLYNDLAGLIQDLDVSVKRLRYSGEEYAAAERDYRLALSQEIARMEIEGRPVTNLYNVARGKQHVANAKYEQIKKEAIYRANLESIQATKLKIKVLQAQIDKEYGANLSD